MTTLILDHPWGLDECFDPTSPGHGVLLHFDQLAAKHRLAMVPLISGEECENLKTGVYLRRVPPTAKAAWIRVVHKLVRRLPAGGSLAVPEPIPIDLSNTWLAALGDALGDVQDWRTPQVIVPRARRSQWPNGKEVGIRCQDNPDLVFRALVELETYEDHDYSLSDLDPWDLRHVYRPIPGTRVNHECRLPKPPKLDKVTLEQLELRLKEARADGWEIDGRFFFIPAAEWVSEGVKQEEWRSGRAFKREYAPYPRTNTKGPIDFRGIVWLWDERERHWDVQVNPYIRVSHDGKKL